MTPARGQGPSGEAARVDVGFGEVNACDPVDLNVDEAWGQPVRRSLPG